MTRKFSMFSPYFGLADSNFHLRKNRLQFLYRWSLFCFSLLFLFLFYLFCFVFLTFFLRCCRCFKYFQRWRWWLKEWRWLSTSPVHFIASRLQLSIFLQFRWFFFNIFILFALILLLLFFSLFCFALFLFHCFQIVCFYWLLVILYLFESKSLIFTNIY